MEKDFSNDDENKQKREIKVIKQPYGTMSILEGSLSELIPGYNPDNANTVDIIDTLLPGFTIGAIRWILLENENNN